MAALALTGCASLPRLDGRAPSAAMTDTAATRLGRAVAAAATAATAAAGASGIYALEKPLEAVAARVVLARAAERSLDVQYYIWHGDTTGFLLFEELWNAAGRGVRVRLLLDDNNTGGLDGYLAALDGHPGIEVRLFNPFANRGSRLLGYVTDFDRLNRRMHNKSFTADNLVTIVGGRNVGDEYFGAGGHTVFADLDVIGAGGIAAQTGSAFDAYWNSESAYPVGLIVDAAAPAAVDKLRERFVSVGASAGAVRYLEAVRATRLVADLLEQRLELDWVPVRLLFDDPAKVLGATTDADLIFTRLAEQIASTQREIDIVSPYFVPGRKGTAALVAFAGRGVKLRIVTNSLAATDVGAVHAGYARRRKPLLRSGARIYELKPDAGAAAAGGGRDGGGKHVPGWGAGGSSSASLHAKTFAVDRSRVFVGSFNFDPRSARHNTEMGVLIDSPELGEGISGALDARAPLDAYEVVLGADGESLEWVEQTPQGEVRHTSEPGAGFLRRLGVGIMSLLPIEGML